MALRYREKDAGNTYPVPMNPGTRKQFGNVNMNGFTCCNGTALESQTKLQDTIYFHSAHRKSLYVNLFIPSTLTWAERKVSVQQISDFPYADTTKLIILVASGPGPSRMTSPQVGGSPG